MGLKPLFLRIKVVFVDFKSHEIQTGIMCSYSAAPAPKVSIKNPHPLARVVIEYPPVKVYRLLCRMNRAVVHERYSVEREDSSWFIE